MLLLFCIPAYPLQSGAEQLQVIYDGDWDHPYQLGKAVQKLHEPGWETAALAAFARANRLAANRETDPGVLQPLLALHTLRLKLLVAAKDMEQLLLLAQYCFTSRSRARLAGLMLGKAGNGGAGSAGDGQAWVQEMHTLQNEEQQQQSVSRATVNEMEVYVGPGAAAGSVESNLWQQLKSHLFCFKQECAADGAIQPGVASGSQGAAGTGQQQQQQLGAELRRQQQQQQQQQLYQHRGASGFSPGVWAETAGGSWQQQSAAVWDVLWLDCCEALAFCQAKYSGTGCLYKVHYAQAKAWMALGRPDQAAAVLQVLFRDGSNPGGRGGGSTSAEGFVIHMSPLQSDIAAGNDQQGGAGGVRKRGKGKKRRQQQEAADGSEEAEADQAAAAEGDIPIVEASDGVDEDMADAVDYTVDAQLQESVELDGSQEVLLGGTLDGEAPPVVSVGWGEPEDTRAFYSSVRRCLLLYLQVRGWEWRFCWFPSVRVPIPAK